ncbi:MAG TPA: ABC transporter ATP-binding protein [bacterium]|nr:ABC transporter ATP-binding protein [bacterium]
MTANVFALEIRNLQKRYRRHVALKDLNLTVPRGAVMGLVGPNGAGKTTAFAIIAGLLRSNGGSINVLGEGPYDPVRHKGRLSLLPQDAHIPGHSRVKETLVYFARLQGLAHRPAVYAAEKTLEWVDLSDRADAPVSTLSHGMIRRLSAGQAFIGDPDLVLLDEPTSGLDPRQVVRIRELVLSRRGRQTIVVSSHILSEIEAACDHIAFIDKGVTTRQDAMDNIVHRNRSLTIFLTRPLTAVPDALPQQFPEVSFRLSDNGTRMIVHFQDGHSASTMNRMLLPVLFSMGIDVEEIRRGSDLEKIYLEDPANQH